MHMGMLLAELDVGDGEVELLCKPCAGCRLIAECVDETALKRECAWHG